MVDPSPRDQSLKAAAIYFGREITSLRAVAADKLVSGLSKPRAIRLLAAIANQQFLTLRERALKQARPARRNEPVHLEQLNQRLVPGASGQEMTADDSLAYLVDSLPHWLHHIQAIPDDAEGPEPKDGQQFAARAIAIASVEHSLKQLWHGALWEENRLRVEGDSIIEEPTNRDLMKRWFVWDMRQSALLAWEHQIDAGAAMVAGDALAAVVPAIGKTVVKIEWPKGGRRRFVIGPARGDRPEQRSHVSEREMLERLYTGLFLDEPLPRTGPFNFTCRELNSAWWVLCDLARLAAVDLGKPWMPNDRAVGRFALAVGADELARVLSECLEIETERAGAILELFTCDPSDSKALFAKSFWSMPLLPGASGDRRYIILAPLLTGSPLKRVEAWMERGGISDNSGVKGRGKPFEAYVRKDLTEALQENGILKDHRVYPNSIKRKGNSEEIDLLIRIGRSLIVGEVKCFVSPSEPLEKHNYLRALARAVKQAASKRDWVAANLARVAQLMGCGNATEVPSLTLHPLVVLNQGFGFGLVRDGVPIVDLHYLRLLLGDGSYQGETRFERDVGMFYHSVKLYDSLTSFERRLEALLGEPPPLQRYSAAVGWRRQPFPTSNGRPFFIEMPTLVQMPADLDAVERLDRFVRAHRDTASRI
ncbi:MAG TPA: hypothetical protein VFP12_15455 [Allosphingosinicella sp.]|nr:hypothetical protein [Allosphingosinicella sp.]